MSSILLLPSRKYPALPGVGNDLASHTRVLEALREAVQTHERRNADKLASFVRVQDLIDLGAARLIGNNKNRLEWLGSSSSSGASALADLTDVDLTGLADGDHLVYDSNYGLWLPETPASGGGGGWTLINSHVPGSASATLSVSSIPSTYTHLMFIFSGRGDAAGQTFRDVFIRFNGDSGSNYDQQDAHFVSNASGLSQAVGQTSALFASTMPAASATANRVLSATGWVPNYKNTTFDKQGWSGSGFTIGTGGFNVGSGCISFNWRPSSPAAITSITLIPQSGNFVANSGLWVYGM